MMMRKASFTLMSLLLAVMVVSLTFLIPSGAITEEARMRYDDALYARQDEAEEEAAVKPRAVLASAVMSDILPVDNVRALPIDLFTPGSTPIAENFTESSYRDDTIIVEMEQRRMFDSDVFIAFVRVATPSQLRAAVAGTKIRSTSVNKTSTMAKAYNGIVAISGDNYSDDETKKRYVVRQGEVLREKTSSAKDILVIDELGDFHILPAGNDSQAKSLAAIESEHEIINGYCFGPALVIDGKKFESDREYGWDPTGDAPRAGIAQLDTLVYALVVVNGRTNSSTGVNHSEFADIMLELGAKQAYNLDGGNSATLVFNGEVYNDKPQSERSIADIIYFASAIDE